MTATLQILQWLSGLIVLAEALNKLERTAPCARGLAPHDRLVASLKALAWLLLALGAGAAVFAPLLLALGWQAAPLALLQRVQNPLPNDVAVIAGFAVLIIRTRVKEG